MPHSQVQCDDCYYWYESQQEMTDHEQVCHSNIQLNDSYELTDRLDEIFNMNVMNADYGYQFSGKYSAPVQSKKPKNDILSRYHETFWQECPVEGCTYKCEKSSTKVFAHHLSTHPHASLKLRTLSFEDEETLAPYRCAKCNFFYQAKKALRNHMRQNLCDGIIDKIIFVREQQLWDQIRFKKKIRHKARQDIDDIIELHKFTFDANNKIESLTCRYCLAKNSEFAELEKHIENSHGRRAWLQYRRTMCQVLPVACTACSLCFASNDDYEEHIETKHCEFYKTEVGYIGNMRKMKGYSCSKEGIISVSLQVSMDRLPKTAIRSKPSNKKAKPQYDGELKDIDCPDCRKKFFRLADVYNHILRVHGKANWVQYRTKENPLTPYRCTKCHFVFSHKYSHPCERYANILCGKDEDVQEDDNVVVDKYSGLGQNIFCLYNISNLTPSRKAKLMEIILTLNSLPVLQLQ